MAISSAIFSLTCFMRFDSKPSLFHSIDVSPNLLTGFFMTVVTNISSSILFYKNLKKEFWLKLQNKEMKENLNLVFKSIPEHVVIHDTEGHKLIDNGILDEAREFTIFEENPEQTFQQSFDHFSNLEEYEMQEVRISLSQNSRNGNPLRTYSSKAKKISSKTTERKAMLTQST